MTIIGWAHFDGQIEPCWDIDPFSFVGRRSLYLIGWGIPHWEWKIELFESLEERMEFKDN